MGFLNILGYIGVGLAAALVLLVISFLWSRPKETVLYEGNVIKQRGEGSWVGASVFSLLVMIVFAILLFYNLAHFSVLKSIGLGLLASIIIWFLMLVASHLFYKNIKRMTENGFWILFSIILCMLNGAGFAVLVSIWGWF